MSQQQPERTTQAAVRKCAEWLRTCLELGWRRDELDWLEELWWKHHDANGNLKAGSR